LAWRPEFVTAAGLVATAGMLMFLMDQILERRQEEYPLASLPLAPQTLAAAAICAVTLLFTANQVSAFIYFQF